MHKVQSWLGKMPGSIEERSITVQQNMRTSMVLCRIDSEEDLYWVPGHVP